MKKFKSLREIKSHMFRGKRHVIDWHKPRDGDGECGDGEMMISLATKREIKRHKTQELEIIDTAIHEALHACYPDLDEDAIRETATDLTLFLKRIIDRIGI